MFCSILQYPIHRQPENAGQQEQSSAGGKRQIQAHQQQRRGCRRAGDIGHAVGGVRLAAQRHKEPEQAAAVHGADGQQIQRAQYQMRPGEGRQRLTAHGGQQRPEQQVAGGACGHGQYLAAVGKARQRRDIQLCAGGRQRQTPGRGVEQVQRQHMGKLVAQGGGENGGGQRQPP